MAETGSTNADALALAREGAPEGVVLVADHQTAGRGRLGRSWQAPPGSSLLMTVLLRPPPEEAELVTFAAAVSMAEAVEATTGVRALLKWPNDLTVDDRKLAGVLAEADWHDDAVAVCVGIGVNCNWPDEVPAELRDTLVALNGLTGAEVDRRALLDAFLGALGSRYPKPDRAALLAAWRARSATLGRRVRVDLGGDQVEGTAADVTTEGHLVVETASGPRTFAVGDVTHLRHA
jgi:BirA family biotin operon repressor/biotin-[acetyl-CoA-carboxylase] ligase